MMKLRENDFEFIKLPKYSKTGKYMIASIIKYQGTASKVVIPYQLQDAIVEVIQIGAFLGNSTITEVHIPDTVETISSYAFSQCPNLEKVVIYRAGHNLSKSNCIIGRETFAKNKKLKFICSVIPLHLIESQAFCDCPILESVPKILELPYETFQNCKSLKR